MAQMATSSTDAVDAVLEKLLSVRGERPGKQVALEDNEIRMLCIRAVSYTHLTLPTKRIV